jgi:hypothetical protein
MKKLILGSLLLSQIAFAKGGGTVGSDAVNLEELKGIIKNQASVSELADDNGNAINSYDLSALQVNLLASMPLNTVKNPSDKIELRADTICKLLGDRGIVDKSAIHGDPHIQEKAGQGRVLSFYSATRIEDVADGAQLIFVKVQDSELSGEVIQATSSSKLTPSDGLHQLFSYGQINDWTSEYRTKKFERIDCYKN